MALTVETLGPVLCDRNSATGPNRTLLTQLFLTIQEAEKGSLSSTCKTPSVPNHECSQNHLRKWRCDTNLDILSDVSDASDASLISVHTWFLVVVMTTNSRGSLAGKATPIGIDLTSVQVARLRLQRLSLDLSLTSIPSQPRLKLPSLPPSNKLAILIAI